MRQTGSQLPLKNCLFWRVGGRHSSYAANHVILLFKSATLKIKSKVIKQTCLGRSMCVPWANRIDRGWGAECGLWFRRCEYGSKIDAEGTTILIMFNFEYSLVFQPSIPKLSSILSHDRVKMERWPSHTRVISLVGTRHTPEHPAKGLLLYKEGYIICSSFCLGIKRQTVFGAPLPLAKWAVFLLNFHVSTKNQSFLKYFFQENCFFVLT